MENYLAIIVPTFNRPKCIEALLKSIECQSIKPNKVIIVDQSCDRLTRDVVINFKNLNCEYVKLNKQAVNIARNIGLAKCASHKYIALLDDDLILDKNYLQILTEKLDINEAGNLVAAMGSMKNLSFKKPSIFEKMLQLPHMGSGSVQRSGFATYPHWLQAPTTCKYVSAGLAVYRGNVISKIKFDESILGGAPCEDTDISARIIQHGAILFEPSAKCIHEESPINRLGRKELIQAIIQNTFYIGIKNKNAIKFSFIRFYFAVIGMLIKYVSQTSLSGASGVISGLHKVITRRFNSVRIFESVTEIKELH